jgi:hypothetical protein
MKLLSFALGMVLTLTGCAQFSPSHDERPSYKPANFRGDIKLPADLQRVAVLPAHGGNVVEPESAAGMDTVLIKALQRQVRFEAIAISREDLRQLFGTDSFGSTDALPHGFLEKIAEKYGVDAILFTDLTVYQAYRPISLGFRAKLATARDTRLVWAFDEVFSAGQSTMVASVRDYYREGDQTAPVDPTPAVLQSPTRFGAVAADLMFKTLPLR